jgi:mitogen-activated protein kinase organizer 1
MTTPNTTAIPSRIVNTLSSHTGPVNAITFSSLGGTYILTGSSDRQIHLARTEPPSSSSSSTTTSPPTSTPIQKYTSHGYPILDLTVSTTNTHFASCGGDRAVFLWDVQQTTSPTSPLRRLGSNTSSAHTQRITCVSFATPTSSVIASGSDDRSVRLWDVKSHDPKPLMVLSEAKDNVSSLAIPVDDGAAEIVVASVDGRVRSYDLRMGRVTTDVVAAAVTSVVLSRDAKTMLVGSLDGKIRLMDRKDGSCLRTFPAEGQEAGYRNDSFRLRSCFAMNDAVVISGSEADGLVRAWDVVSGKSVGSVEQNAAGKVVSTVSWREGSRAEGRQGVFAAGGAAGTVTIYAS